MTKTTRDGAVAAGPARFAALHSRNFRILWSGLIFSNVGSQMQLVAESWLILQRTDSPLALGLVSLFFGLPMIGLSLVGGAVADRFDRVTIVKLTQLEGIALPVVLAAVIATGHLQVWMLYAGALIGGAALAFDSPARQALLPELVPPEHLLNGTALMSAVWTGAQLLGPALGGLLLGTVGAAWLFFLNGVSTIAVLWALLSLRDIRTRADQRREPALERLVGGARFAWAHPGVLALLALTLAAGVLGRSYNTLLPVFARDLWHRGPQGYGLLLVAPGAGSLLGAFGVASRQDIGPKGRFVIAANLVFAGVLAAFALLPPFAAGLALLVLAGVASTAFGAAVGTMLQLATPAALRGRVMSLYTITLIGGPSLGGLLAGAAGQAFGAQLAVRVSAALLALATLLLLRPVVRPLPSLEPGRR